MNAQGSIIVVGGLHGDEHLGIEVVNRLRHKPIPGIEAIFGNPMAAAVNARFIDQDLNRVFPGNLNGCLEEVRAYQIMQVVNGYDLVIDFHNTTSNDNDCGFVGETYLQKTLQLSLHLGLNQVVIATYDCINKFLPNCLSVEISVSSPLNCAEYWYEKLLQLSMANLHQQSLEDLHLFKFIDRVYTQQYQQLKLNFQNFVALSPQDKTNLGLAETLEIYPILVDPSLRGGKYCALVERISTPVPTE